MSTKKTVLSGVAQRAQRDARLAEQADPAEKARRILATHERVIENAVRSFVDIGQSLLAIRTERLYLGEYSNFSEYLDARWDVSESYANRMINAALVAIKATPIGVEINSEAVARELADLADEPEQLRQVWDEATRRAAGGRVTAALIKEVRKALDPPKPRALEGEVVDPVDSISDEAKAAIQARLDQTAAGTALHSPPADDEPSIAGTTEGTSATGVGDQADRPAPVVNPTDHRDADPGETDGGQTPSGQTGSEVLPPKPPTGSVDGRGQAGAGVSRPVPDPDLVQTPIGPMTREFAEKLDRLVPDPNPHREWQSKFLVAVFAAAKAMRGYTGAEIAEKADAQVRGEFASFVADMDELLRDVSKAQIAAADNVVPLRRVQ